uniref:Pre-mRNA-splicing factor ISY1 homolog n=1 Tax=Sus scrofa TaxID=9823 RepID=A0A5G2RDZ4_PIG
MARNAEKAMTALARFRQAQLEEGKVKERRPFLASECTELPKAEKWRRQIIGEISKKVAQIQNAGLGEFRIRDLNDEINKLLREKGHWEVRIKELGGPDYGKVGPKMLDHEGKEVPGNRGYKYFGAAKDLPGVRELFEKEPLPPPRKTRAELMKAIDFEYYGYLDEDDGVIVPLEQEYEKKRSQSRTSGKVESRERGPAGKRRKGGGGRGRGGQHLCCSRGGVRGRQPGERRGGRAAEVHRPRPGAITAGDRGGACAEEEDGTPPEVRQRDPTGPERRGQKTAGVLGPSLAVQRAVMCWGSWFLQPMLTFGRWHRRLPFASRLLCPFPITAPCPWWAFCGLKASTLPPSSVLQVCEPTYFYLGCVRQPTPWRPVSVSVATYCYLLGE